MSSRGQDGDRTDEALDDATVEDLLAGRYEGEAPDLVALNELFREVRSFSDRPAPLPSGSLARMLDDSTPARGAGARTTSRRSVPDLHIGSFRRAAHDPDPATAPPRRSRRRYRPIVAAAAVAAVLAVVVTAGSARLLPGPTQNVVAKFVQALTPFDFPEQRNEETVGPKPPSSQMGAPSEEPAPQGGPADSSGPRTGEPGTDESRSVGRDGTASHSGPSGVNAPPTPPRMVPEGNGRSSPGVPGSVPGPPPQRHAFSAELVGATGSDAPGDPDGNGTAGLDTGPRSDELCLTLFVSGIAPVTAVHLHEAAGASRRVLATWTGPTPEGSAGCVGVDEQLLKKLRRQPTKYYLDVHTTEFPNGALRGPLAN